MLRSTLLINMFLYCTVYNVRYTVKVNTTVQSQKIDDVSEFIG
jgi:hypothetical protein